MAGSLCGLVDMLGSKKEGVGSLSYSSSLAPSFALCFHFFYFRRSRLLLGGVTHSPHRSKLIRGDARLMQTFPQRHTLRFSLSLFSLFFFFCTKERLNGKVIQTCLHPALIVSLPMSAFFSLFSFLFLCLCFPLPVGKELFKR